MDFVETATLVGMRQAVRNLPTNLEDADGLARIRVPHPRPRREIPALIDEILGSAGITAVRWVKTSRAELLGRRLNWNDTRLR